MSVRETILDNLATGFEAVKNDRGYSGTIKTVQRWKSNALALDKFAKPIVFVVDPGRETILAKDSTKTRFTADIVFQAYVQMESTKDALAALNDIAADIKKYIVSVANTTLGATVLRLELVGTEQHAVYDNQKLADCVVNARLIYYVTTGTY